MGINDLPEPIQKLIMEGTSQNKVMQPGHFGVTELLMCPRKTYFRRILGEEITLQQAWWFYRGNLLDDAWTRAFRRNQVRVTHRIKGYPVIISGRFDFEDVDGAIADLKTVSDLHFIKRDGFKQEHKEQLIFYCYCEAKNKARLYYVSFQDALRFDLEFSEKEMKTVIDELELKAVEIWEALEKHAKTGKLEPPERDEKYDEAYWECRYCSFRGKCYDEEGSKEKEGEDTREEGTN